MNSVSGFASSIPARDQACVRNSEVGEQMEALERNTESVRSRLEALTERLSNVLRSIPTGKGETMPTPVLVPLAARLRNQNDRLQFLDAGLAQLLESLEL